MYHSEANPQTGKKVPSFQIFLVRSQYLLARAFKVAPLFIIERQRMLQIDVNSDKKIPESLMWKMPLCGLIKIKDLLPLMGSPMPLSEEAVNCLMSDCSDWNHKGSQKWSQWLWISFLPIRCLYTLSFIAYYAVCTFSL